MAAPPFISVDRDDTDVLYVEVIDDPAEFPAAWRRLETTVGSLKGRHFVGAFFPGAGVYWACVEASVDADDLGLRRGVVPGGQYLRARLTGQPPGLYEQIPVTMDALAAAAGNVDPDRPGVEVYRRYDEVDLLLPVQPTG